MIWVGLYTPCCWMDAFPLALSISLHIKYHPSWVISPIPMPAGILTSSRCSFLDPVTRLLTLYTCFLSQHCQAGGAIDLPDCPEQTGIPSPVSLTGLQCCFLSLLSSRRTFLDCVCLEVIKYELAALQPSRCSWEGHSPGPPAVQTLSIFASPHEPTSWNSVRKCMLMVQTAWESCWTTFKSLSVFWLKKPDRQTPGQPRCVGPFFPPPSHPYTGLSLSLPGEE